MPAIGRHISRLSGYAPALPTPFGKDGCIDTAAFENLCERQIQEGATALVVCGTTGEAPTLNPAEHTTLIQIAAGVACGQVPVIAGAGSNCTSHAIELTKDAEVAGADGILSVVPYYNKPTQRGMQAHFDAIAGATGLPIILYDVPSRTACSLGDETIARLAENRKFIGLKDASGDLTRPLRLRSLVGPHFRLLTGDDATAPAFLAQGGNGCISVTSNVAPGLCRQLFMACRQGEPAAAQRWAATLADLTAVLFRENSPSSLKYAMSLLGLMSPMVRLPLVELTDTTKGAVAAVMTRLGENFPDFVIGKVPNRRQAVAG
jgi:4-hydroxy-tetrahydrodipicolinate synthase